MSWRLARYGHRPIERMGTGLDARCVLFGRVPVRRPNERSVVRRKCQDDGKTSGPDRAHRSVAFSSCAVATGQAVPLM